MDKLDDLVADHLESRLLQPKWLETILASVIDRRQERAERRGQHIAELRQRAARPICVSSAFMTPLKGDRSTRPNPR